ncbi:MAG: coenzyme F430 synthase [Methanobrevibacter sp.]|nr:coenzyme F430 synthase [Methanobrevibacter sp.]
MNVFLVDLTHGGVKISSELSKSKRFEKVFAYDLYNTLKEEDETVLKIYDVEVLKSLAIFKNELKSNSMNLLKSESSQEDMEKDLIINPIHSPLNIKEIIDQISHEINVNCEDLSQLYEIINHHKATKLVLEDWKEEAEKQNVKTIELTGVKGKTSTAFLLKEIFIEDQKDILLLSSLGARLFKNNKSVPHSNEKNDRDLEKTKKVHELILQKNISITPANIINTIQLAKKIANPKCSYFPKCGANKNLKEEDEAIEEYNNNPYKNLNYDIAIFENSLGICGLGDIGILTNLIENYPIAKGTSNAREAKRQVFDSPLIIIENETLNQHYKEESEKYSDKTISFSLNENNNKDEVDDNKVRSNVFCKNIEYDIDQTKIDIVYQNLKTINQKAISGEFSLNCFAPGPHHVLNILTAVSTALALEIDEETIAKGISNFNGIDGRTQVKTIENSRIIEEINPGINTKAIESSINMIKDIDNYYIIIGGKYGVTCEEIDEDKLSNYLNEYLSENPNTNLILTDELGNSLKDKLSLLNENEYEIKFIEDYEEAKELAIKENKNILFIYRSNYSQVSKR